MPRRGENIRKRSDGRWEGRVKIAPDLNNKSRYKSLYGKTYSEVKRKMLDYLKQGDHRPRRTERITLGELLKMWQKCSRRKNKASTEMKYDFLIQKHLIPSLGHLLLCELNSRILNRFLSEKLSAGRLDGKGGLSPAYVRTLEIILRSALEFGEKEKLCGAIIFYDSIPKTGYAAPKILTKSHQRKLESYLFSHPDTTNLGILLTLRAGLRIGEVCSLRWEDINLSEKELYIKTTVIRVKDQDNRTVYRLDVPKTKSSVRTIPITDDLHRILVRLSSEGGSGFLLSGTEDFVRPPTYSYRYHQVLKKLTIPDLNYHSLRHTFATRCIEAGMDEKSLSEILGHANVSITLNTYVHPSMELKRDRLTRLIAMLAG